MDVRIETIDATVAPGTSSGTLLADESLSTGEAAYARAELLRQLIR